MKITVELDWPVWVKNLVKFAVPVSLILMSGVALAVPKTFTPGETLTASDLNADFSNIENRLLTLEAQARPPSAFRALFNGAASIPVNVVTVGHFDQIDFDLGSEYVATTGVFAPKNAGYYLITCKFDYATTASGEYGSVLLVNGGQIDVGGSPASTDVLTEVTAIVKLAAGDAVTCNAYQNSASPQPLQAINSGRNEFSAFRLY